MSAPFKTFPRTPPVSYTESTGPILPHFSKGTEKYGFLVGI